MIFYNPEIYINDNDYIIGGFHIEKNETNDISKIYFNIENRVTELLEEYISEDVLSEVEKAEKPLINIEKTHSDACRMVRDFLKIETGSCTKQSIVRDVMNSPQFETWFSDIKERFKRLPIIEQTSAGVSSEMKSSKSGIGIKRATEYTNNASFSELLEALSLIDL